MLFYIMIIFISKFLHLFSLLLAGGGVIGTAVIQSIYKKEGKIPEPHLAKGFRVLAFFSLIAIITMWTTGIFQTIVIYGSFNLGWSFHLKLFEVILFLIFFLVAMGKHNNKNKNKGNLLKHKYLLPDLCQ